MKNITSNKYFIPGFAVVVFGLVAIILVFTGGGVPKDAVASVDGEPIPKTQFNKTLAIYSTQTAGQNGGKVVVPDPPNFTNCIASKKKTSKKLSQTALKKQCQSEWNTAKEQIMASLIQAKWYELEAKELDINITPAQVQQRFLPLKQQSFPKEADYQKFLKSTGQSQTDILALVKSSMIQEKVREKANKAATPTQKQIEEDYKKNKDKYAQPATRDLVLVFNSKKDKAAAAAAAIEGGDSFSAVAKKYSQDAASKAKGGAFPGVTKGQFEPTLDKAIFNAKKGELVGPIKTQFGYYVFKVEKTVPAKQQTLKQATPQIKQALQAAAQQKATDQFQENFTEKWRKKTRCADLYKVEQCKNGPKPKEGPTAQTGSQ